MARDENDPFLTDGRAPQQSQKPVQDVRSPSRKPSSDERTGRLLLATLLPWLVFSTVVVLFMFLYHEKKNVVWGIVIGVSVIWLFVFMIGAFLSSTLGASIGFLCLLASMLGVVTGFFIFDWYLNYYYRIHDGVEYKDIDPNGGAITSDAGVINFIDGSFIDDKRTIGFVAAGSIFCVAPVAKQTAYSSSVIYWAIGENCCEKRSNFQCKASRDFGPKSAIIANDKAEHFEHFNSAVKMAMSVYHLNAPTQQVTQLMRFASDTKKAMNYEWTSAFAFGMGACSLYLFTSFGAAAVVLQALPRVLFRHTSKHTRGAVEGTPYEALPNENRYRPS